MSDLDSPYPLDAALIRRYRADGYLKLKDVLSASALADYGQAVTYLVRALTPEVRLAQIEADYGPAMRERFARWQKRAADQPASTYARAFTQVTNLWRYSDVVERLVRSPRLASIAARLMGVGGVRLYHDQALYKEAHGGHTPWHVDQYYWPLSSDHTVTAWIPLQAVPLEMGPVAFARGSHHTAREGVARELAISDESEAQLARLLQGSEVDESPFDVGEVSFHAGWTCHRAGPNNTDVTRAAFTIIYMDRDIRRQPSARRHHDFDAAMWLPGIEPGEAAASPLNPVLA